MTTIVWLFIGLTALFAFIQICYYLFIFSKFAFDKTRKRPVNRVSDLVPVSVVVYSKNNLKNLQQFLPLILAQNYPDYEVIVINDGSWDETAEFIEELMKNEPKVKIVDIKLEEKYHRGKKFALTLAIKAANHEWLLFTDADCKPLSENWIREMSFGMGEDKEIVLGYSRYKRKNSLFNLFARWENFFTAMRYFSYALGKNAYMGIGKNLAYRKSLFFKVKGFATHQHILSGDDSLFVNETANKTNVSVVYSYDSFTESQEKITWKSWWNERKRRFYTSRFYKSSHKFKLRLFNAGQLFFYTFLTLSLAIGLQYWYYILGIFTLRLIIQSIILLKSMEKLRISKIFSLFWLLDILMVPYYLTVGFAGSVVKKLK